MGLLGRFQLAQGLGLSRGCMCAHLLWVIRHRPQGHKGAPWGELPRGRPASPDPQKLGCTCCFPCRPQVVLG